MKRFHSLLHVPYETEGNILSWANENGFALSSTALYDSAPLPNAGEVDFLAVMGAPICANDEKIYPWLIEEKRFIERAMRRNIPVLGVGFGAECIASVLGAAITNAERPEMGWRRVRITEEGEATTLFSALESEFLAFHWRRTMFDIPLGAVRTAESDECENQAFSLGDTIVGVRFHLETTKETAQARLMRDVSERVLDENETLAEEERFVSLEANMHCLLTRMYDVMRIG